MLIIDCNESAYCLHLTYYWLMADRQHKKNNAINSLVLVIKDAIQLEDLDLQVNLCVPKNQVNLELEIIDMNIMSNNEAIRNNKEEMRKTYHTSK